MQTSVNISDNILQWIIAQVHLETLPERIAKNFELWGKKEKIPTFNQIEDASKATGIPLGYFFLQTPPAEDLSFIEYRTIDSVELTHPSRELIDTMHNMQLVQEWMRSQLLEDGISKLPFIGSQKGETNTAQFANAVRKILNLEINWFKEVGDARESFLYLRTAMSNVGTIVMTSGIVENNTHRPLSIDEFRAFAMVDDIAPLIFINGNDSNNGKLFSLLHEFVHLCIGEDSLFNERYSSGQRVSRTEMICNAVASEILVPQTLFMEAWQTETRNVDAAQAIRILAKDFKCGTIVIARKALDNGLIDQSLYKTIADLAIKLYNEQKKQQKENGGGDYYRTAANRIDQRFLQMLAGSVATGKTPYSEAFRLTNTNRFTFAKLTERFGGEVG